MAASSTLPDDGPDEDARSGATVLAAETADMVRTGCSFVGMVAIAAQC